MAFQMLAYIIVGWFIGNIIDKKMELETPIFGLLFLIFFLGGYMFKLYRDLTQES